MLTNRLFKVLAVIVIVVIALVTVSFTASSRATQPYLDYALRHPGTLILAPGGSASATEGSDWYQRHRAELGISRSPDITEYFFRHPELRAARGPVDLTDYYFRHFTQ